MGRTPVRVALVIDSIAGDTSGTERQLLGLIERLDRARIEPLLVVLSSSRWLETHTPSCAVEVLGYRGLLKPSLPRVVSALARLLRDKQIDVVLTFFEDAMFVGLLGVWWSRAHPVLMQSRRDIGMGNARPWYHALFDAARVVLADRFDAVVVNGEAIKRWVADSDGVPPARIRVIRNGVELLGPSAVDFPLADQPGTIWFGITANLKPIKRIDVLIEALARLDRQVSWDWQCVVMGEGPERERLSHLIQQRGLVGRVHLVGSVHDVRSYLQRVDIAILCSDREGLSNAILEYMTLSKPIVATDAGACSELVDEDNGLLVPPGDPVTLAAALMRLGSDRVLRDRMGQGSYKRACEQFNWALAVEQWSSLFETAAAQARHPR